MGSEESFPSETQRQVLNNLEDRRQTVIDSVIAAIREKIPTYVANPAPELEQDLAEHVAANVNLFLVSTLDGGRLSSKDLEFIRAAIRRRVAQGVKLEEVLHAFRVGHEVLWQSIVEESETVGARAGETLELALPVMRYVDAASSEVTESFLRIEHRMQDDLDHIRSQIVDSLVEGRTPTDARQLTLATRFPIGEDHRYVVALVRGISDVGIAELRSEARELGGSSTLRGVVSQVRHDQLIAIFATERKEETDFELIADGLLSAGRGSEATVAVGVSSLCEGVEAVAIGFQEAEGAAQSAAPGEAVVIPRLTALQRAAVMLRSEKLARRIVDPGVRQFLEGGSSDRDALVATAVAYLEAGLNARQAALALHVHRNTVIYRLRKAGDLTGLDLSDASDLIELLVSKEILGKASRSLEKNGARSPVTASLAGEKGASGPVHDDRFPGDSATSGRFWG